MEVEGPFERPKAAAYLLKRLFGNAFLYFLPHIRYDVGRGDLFKIFDPVLRFDEFAEGIPDALPIGLHGAV